MKSLSSEDVRNQAFSAAKRGYAEGEVDDLLDEIAIALDERDAAIERLNEGLAQKEESRNASVADGIDATAHAAREERAEAVTTLLAIAQRTADEHIADAHAAAAEIRASAQREALLTTSTADAEASRVLADAEMQRRRVLGEVQHERQRVADSGAAHKIAAEHAMAELEGHVAQLLATMQGGIRETRSGQLSVVST